MQVYVSNSLARCEPLGWSSPGLTGRSSIPEKAVFEWMDRGVLDRPPSRAMTIEIGRYYGLQASMFTTDATSPSRDTECPSLARLAHPHPTEGAGNAGRQPHPWPACNKKAGGSHHRFSRDIPAFPARWFYGLYVISPGTGFVAPVIGAMRKHRRQFDTSAGVSGPHDFAIRPVLFVGMNDHAAIRDGHRIPASRVVTIARNAPLR